MNKLARSIVIFGAVIIAVLLILLYVASRKMLTEVQLRLNQSMEFMHTQIEQTHSSEYGIQHFEYTPFVCSGLLDYKCQSKKISLYMDDLTSNQHTTREIQLHNFTLSGEDIKSKNHLAFKIATDIAYPTMQSFFGDSKKDPLIAFFNHSADALLPSRLECKQDYVYKVDDEVAHTVTASTHCDFLSQLFTTQFESLNLFAPDTEKPHILGILYEIAMAMNGSLNKEELQAQNVPHELDSLRISLLPKQSFADFIANNEKLPADQKKILQTQFEANLNVMKLFGAPFLSSYLGQDGGKIIQGLDNIARNKTKQLDIAFTLKNPPNFQPIKVLKEMSMLQWLHYIHKNYTISVNDIPK